MRIFITGGTGFVGSHLTKTLVEQGHIVTILTRNFHREKMVPSISLIEGNPTKPGHWQDHLIKNDIIINLAGRSVFCRWNKENKKQIIESRINTTKNIVAAIKQEKKKKITLLNASAVGYYGLHKNEMIDEDYPAGNDFLASVCQQWEATAQEAESDNTRVVLCRFGIILDKNGGALKKMLPIFKFGLGTPLGSGKQWLSWISVQDLIQIFIYLMENDAISGPVNCTAPKPLTNYHFSKTLAKVLRRPFFLPSPPIFLLRFLLGEFNSVVLEGQKVVPKKLLDNGFRFKHNNLLLALSDLI